MLQLMKLMNNLLIIIILNLVEIHSCLLVLFFLILVVPVIGD